MTCEKCGSTDHEGHSVGTFGAEKACLRAQIAALDADHLLDQLDALEREADERRDEILREHFINLMVESVRVDAIETTKFGDIEPDIIKGRTEVEFITGDGQRLAIDWTWRGDPVPELGSKWTLAEHIDGQEGQP